MSERCGCGAELRTGLPFCVACGNRRPAPLAAARPVPRPYTPAPYTPASHRSVAPTQYAQAPVLPAPVLPAPPVHHGAPARSSAPWIMAAAGIVVVAVVAAALVVVMRPAVVYGAAPTAPAAPPVVVTAAPTSVSAPTYTDTTDTTDSLQAAVDADRSSAESLDGQWVAQLSSKRPGTVDGGTTYDASAIWSHYRSLASAQPGALLLWSGDWSVYKESDYWVVVAGRGFSSAAGANAWCSAQGFGPDDCFAKRLSHTDGPAGSTVPRTS